MRVELYHGCGQGMTVFNPNGFEFHQVCIERLYEALWEAQEETRRPQIKKSKSRPSGVIYVKLN